MKPDPRSTTQKGLSVVPGFIDVHVHGIEGTDTLDGDDAIRRIAYELVEDAAGGGVRYMEIRFCPALNVRGSLSLSDVLDASLRGIALAERDHDTRARVIVCALRNMSPAMSLERPIRSICRA